MASLKNIICRIKANLIYKYTFLRFGSKSILRRPLEIRDKKSISIGNGVYIAEQIWLLATKTGKRCEKIFIGNGVQIGHYAHIVANERVCIENDVLIADKVFISDCTHNYEDIYMPIYKQGISNIKRVTIGEKSWIGENVCICGASVGKHCVIGANSVVTKDIPDYSIAVGSPAKVIKRYDWKKNQWVREV